MSELALNERFPEPFEGLSFKDARNLAIDAWREAGDGNLVTRELLDRLRREWDEDQAEALRIEQLAEPAFGLPSTCVEASSRRPNLRVIR